ncbi:MAG: hypothetical protein EBU49_14185, partial [Proteobacteria bacterium]|nr:hypothetical protein [Pseudomonadota bacterium]
MGGFIFVGWLVQVRPKQGPDNKKKNKYFRLFANTANSCPNAALSKRLVISAANLAGPARS